MAKRNHKNISLTVRRVKRRVPDKFSCVMERRMNIFKLVSFGKLHQLNPSKRGRCNRDPRGSAPTAIAGARCSPRPAACTLFFSRLIRTNQTRDSCITFASTAPNKPPARRPLMRHRTRRGQQKVSLSLCFGFRQRHRSSPTVRESVVRSCR